MTSARDWVSQAAHKIQMGFNRSADTHLFLFELPKCPAVRLYMKDESTHPTGSLKHRLARSLFLYGLYNGWIRQDTTIIEALSGSTAVSEAYFARLLGLSFIAVVPRSTSPKKLSIIEFYGGRIELVEDGTKIYEASNRLARETNGHFMDQFTYAERVTDWRGNNNIADSIFEQMQHERHPIPAWIVCSAGTGGTSATIGRYIRYRRFDTRLCVCDPDNSVVYDYFRTGDPSLVCTLGSSIEGIGRPRVEPSFVAGVIDSVVKVPDAASIAPARFLHKMFGPRYGGSTGTNFYGALRIASQMQEGSIVTLMCDPGERYLHTYYSDVWVQEKGINLKPYLEQLERFYREGAWFEVA